MIKDVSEGINIIKEDWYRLPLTAKFFLFYVLICLILTWIDKTLSINFYSSLFKDLTSTIENNIPFTIANILVFIPLPFLLIGRVIIGIKVIKNKIQYPINNMNKDFYIIAFKGRVCILDNKKKEVKWIKSWQTALDLDFVGEWTEVDIDITQPNMLKSKLTTKDGVTLDLSDYKYVNGIRTQGTSGT